MKPVRPIFFLLGKDITSPAFPVYTHKEGNRMDQTVLLTCLRNVFPTKKNFPDDLLLSEIGAKSEQSRAVAQFVGYVQRNMEVGKVMQRNEAIAEGDKLLGIVMQQIQEYGYKGNMPVTITNVCANLNLVDDYLIRKEKERQDWLKEQFPGYWKKMASCYPEIPSGYERKYA
jgi:hypothetical protein